MSTAWLIEHFDGSPNRWLRVVSYGSVNGIPKCELTWVPDASVALRFSRREDAAWFGFLHPEFCTLALITEHVFMEPAVTPTEDK